MKKRISLLLCLVLTLLVVGCSETTHSGFVSEGKNYSAQVTDNKLVLTLKKDTTTETWKIENNPVLFSIDNFIEYDDFVELNITALNNGLSIIKTAKANDVNIYQKLVAMFSNK